MPDDDALIAYRLGAVRSGIQATGLALALLVLYRILPGRRITSGGAYAAVIAVAALAVVGIALLPWKSLFRRGLGMPMLYAWSVCDILLISVAVGATGGGRSELWALYVLTTVFFGAAYPPLSQIVLLAFTLFAYLATVIVLGPASAPATLVVRCGILAIVAFLVSFLAAQLLRLIDSLQEAVGRRERSARLLSTVARSARGLTLDREQTLVELVESAVAMGFEGAAVCMFDHESELFFVLHHRGLPDRYVEGAHRATADVPGMVRRSGRTEVVSAADAEDAGMDRQLSDAGFVAFIGSPVWVDGWLAGALVGARREAILSTEAEAFELLAVHAGMALENTGRFEEILATVQHLEELDRLKDDFLATTSHELRTPLTVILGSGLTLEQQWDSFDDAVRRELVTGLNRNARTLEGLISSLLDFARLGADSVRVAREPVALDELLPAVGARLGFLFSNRPLSIDCEPGLVVDADPRLLERALANLLSNAAQHTPEGTRVRLAAHREGPVAVLTVEDTGEGISDEDARHLGERFYRGGDPNARPTKGLGLGLALVREILSLHGSDLELWSRPGEGSRFSFALPRAGAASASSAPEPRTEPAPRRTA
jgi:signal transduction histidine kinase